MVLKSNSCREREFFRVAKELLASVDANPVERIIVDLRGNGGGDSSIINPLLAGIEQRGYNQRGKLFVLMDRDTYSSGFHGLMKLRKRNAIQFGEASGRRPRDL